MEVLSAPHRFKVPSFSNAGPTSISSRLATTSVLILVPLGMLWGVFFPINKNLWTSSYVVFTAGTALILFGAMYWTIDVKRWRGWWQQSRSLAPRGRAQRALRKHRGKRQ